eukprot:GHVN01015931.1.p1 GENE.GHVN01015931.1~~GHVN01015931.1.p1  ORF type:complete len:143 (+),score=10.85 GHVN01015931.1:131-559(+)
MHFLSLVILIVAITIMPLDGETTALGKSWMQPPQYCRSALIRNGTDRDLKLNVQFVSGKTESHLLSPSEDVSIDRSIPQDGGWSSADPVQALSVTTTELLSAKTLEIVVESSGVEIHRYVILKCNEGGLMHTKEVVTNTVNS